MQHVSLLCSKRAMWHQKTCRIQQYQCINNGSLNGSSNCVFKTSCEMALRAIRIDVNGEEDGLQKRMHISMQCIQGFMDSKASPSG